MTKLASRHTRTHTFTSFHAVRHKSKWLPLWVLLRSLVISVIEELKFLKW